LEIPDELRDAIEALDHPVRTKIVEYLYGGRDATYTELLRMLGVRKGTLTYHLKILTVAAVIYTLSRLDEDFGDMHKAYYRLSPWGKAVADGLMSSFELLTAVEPEGTPEAVAQTPAIEKKAAASG
jgi:DNA-binding transcriptional ArsR family regulator